MKTLFVAALVLAIFTSSCTKVNETPGEEQLTSSASENLSQQQLTGILTAHQWVYQGFYSHYIDEQHKGQRFYDRDSTNNLDEYLADVVFTFYKTHRFIKYVAPFTYHGTWNFSDNKPTYLTLKFGYGTEKDSLLVINVNNLNYLRKDGYSQWYTALIPAK